jgi:Fur family transcriptional regulator, zinc uptake regulator
VLSETHEESPSNTHRHHSFPEKSYPRVPMMQSGQDRSDDDGPGSLNILPLYTSLRAYSITSVKAYRALLRGDRMNRMQPRGANHEQVYRVLRSARGPMTAYQILDAVRPKGISAPPTVYRALNRLMRDGLAHRLESMNAYVACADPQDRHDSAIFAICHDCGHIDEMHEASVMEHLMRKISKHGFAVDQTTIEIQGLCASCAGSSCAR